MMSPTGLRCHYDYLGLLKSRAAQEIQTQLIIDRGFMGWMPPGLTPFREPRFNENAAIDYHRLFFSGWTTMCAN